VVFILSMSHNYWFNDGHLFHPWAAGNIYVVSTAPHSVKEWNEIVKLSNKFLISQKKIPYSTTLHYYKIWLQNISCSHVKHIVQSVVNYVLNNLYVRMLGVAVYRMQTDGNEKYSSCSLDK